MTKQWQKYLYSLSRKQSNKLKIIIKKLISGNWEWRDIKPLKAETNIYRCRAWNIRIVFGKRNNQIKIIKINNRWNIYK